MGQLLEENMINNLNILIAELLAHKEKEGL